MRKSLLAVAVLGAFAANAMAADVTLYGIVDEGLVYSSVKAGDAKRTHKFSLDSGIQSGSRWGLKGGEDLGNGYKVGFILESGFSADNGKMAQGDRLFGRESLLYVTGPYGEIGVGRTGGVGAAGVAGRYAKSGMLSALGTSWGDYSANAPSTIGEQASRIDNSITYQTPKFAGFQAAVQYSFKMDDKTDTSGVEGKASTDRFYGASLTYENGPFAALLSASSVNYASNDGVENWKTDDSIEVTLGGSYDFGVAKVYAAAQYFDDMDPSAFNKLSSSIASYSIKGYGLNLSVSAPLAGGTAICGLGWLDAESADKDWVDEDIERIRFAVGYTYPLSKRTNLYAVAGVGQDKSKIKDDETTKTKYYKAAFGIRHRF